MSYENNYEGNKPPQTVEQSLKYLSGHISFQLKKDMVEIISPLSESLRQIASSADSIAKKLGGHDDSRPTS